MYITWASRHSGRDIIQRQQDRDEGQLAGEPQAQAARPSVPSPTAGFYGDTNPYGKGNFGEEGEGPNQ